MKNSIRRILAIGLLIVVGPASAGGGDWKMGPFGPYWDDNSWPEFTPMYWMEEFMNRLDDDNDEIQEWMMRNQFPGQYPGTGLSGSVPYSAWNTPGTAPQTGTIIQNIRPMEAYRPDPGSSRVDNADTAYSDESNSGAAAKAPHSSQYVPSSGQPAFLNVTPQDYARMPEDLQLKYKKALDQEYPDPWNSGRSERPLPRLTPQEYARMPAQLQQEYRRAIEREYSQSSLQPSLNRPGNLPKLTPDEYARMPDELQREYRRAFERAYSQNSPQAALRDPATLPRLTREEYARMPEALQREYRQAFDAGSSQFPQQMPQSGRLPELTREEFARMPEHLQQAYKRTFERQYAEFQAQQAARARNARQRRNYP